ncbi:MAG TPA: DoxX family protein [Acidimicrobiales bacterium]|nr:DoxX family protein [Acidimicrobiales bacterium]
MKMSVAASLLSIVLFLAFGSAGAQKIIFNPVMSKAADHLGFTKRSYRAIGLVEVLGAVGLLVGLAAKGSSLLAIVNETAAGGLFVMMGLAVSVHLRKGDKAKYFAPALVLGVLAGAELAFRLN